MKIEVVSIGTKMPGWVQTGYLEYAKRMPRECALSLVEVPAIKRTKQTDIDRLIISEGKALLAKAVKNSYLISLDVNGEAWDTVKLSNRLQYWLNSTPSVALLIGGPDGLSDECKAQSKEMWSLSALTLPHPLVRVLVAEALYRAWSFLNGHPYHRGQ